MQQGRVYVAGDRYPQYGYQPQPQAVCGPHYAGQRFGADVQAQPVHPAQLAQPQWGHVAPAPSFGLDRIVPYPSWGRENVGGGTAALLAQHPGMAAHATAGGQPVYPGQTAFHGPLTQPQQAWMRDAALVRDAGGIITQTNIPTEAVEQPVPFASVTLAIGASATLIAQPSFSVQVNRLFVPSQFGPDVVVDNLIVGRKTQFLSAGGVGAAAFSEVSRVRLRGDTCTLGQQIELVLRNTSAAPVTVDGAAVFGAAGR